MKITRKKIITMIIKTKITITRESQGTITIKIGITIRITKL